MDERKKGWAKMAAFLYNRNIPFAIPPFVISVLSHFVYHLISPFVPSRISFLLFLLYLPPYPLLRKPLFSLLLPFYFLAPPRPRNKVSCAWIYLLNPLPFAPALRFFPNSIRRRRS